MDSELLFENDKPQGAPDDEIDDGMIGNGSPLCWACGWPMEWTGEEREVDLEGGEIIISEPIYRCVNPDCEEDER